MAQTHLFTANIGSHLWGHDTAASDLDHLVVYADDPREILAGIGPSRTRKQRFIDHDDGPTDDIQYVEVGHLVDLLLTPVPNAILWVMSPRVMAENDRYSADIAALREIVPATMARAIHRSANGWAHGYLKRAATATDEALRQKCVLGCRRVIDFGIRYLDGEIAFGPTEMGGTVDERLQALADAHARSRLPERVPEEPYRRWLCALRMKMLESGAASHQEAD